MADRQRTFENKVDGQTQVLNALNRFISKIEEDPQNKSNAQKALRYIEENFRTIVDNHKYISECTLFYANST